MLLQYIWLWPEPNDLGLFMCEYKKQILTPILTSLWLVQEEIFF